MTERFSFKPRSRCICGNRVDNECRTYQKSFQWGEISFRQCPVCQSWIQSPQLTAESLATWYSSENYYQSGSNRESAYLDYFNDEDKRLVDARSRIRRDLKTIVSKGGSALEIGCATGSFLSALRETGMRVYGIDLSEIFSSHARDLYNLEVSVGDFMASDFKPGSLDLIVMLGTWSGMQNLEQSLQKINTLLKPEGVFYFNFPYAGSWIQRLYGKHFWMFAPSVSALASLVGCRKALQHAGLSVMNIRQDYQYPTLGKILGHGQLRCLYPLAKKLSINTWVPPVPIPIPGVVVCCAKRMKENV